MITVHGEGVIGGCVWPWCGSRLQGTPARLLAYQEIMAYMTRVPFVADCDPLLRIILLLCA